MDKLYTIGTNGKSAEKFFEILREAGIKRVVDVRLNNTSQFAGFTKREDLKYFLIELCQIEYTAILQFAPTLEILKSYRYKNNWNEYEKQFKGLIKKRKIENILPLDKLLDSCLLCAESLPEYCHRRLVAEYLIQYWGDIEIVHL